MLNSTFQASVVWVWLMRMKLNVKAHINHPFWEKFYGELKKLSKQLITFFSYKKFLKIIY